MNENNTTFQIEKVTFKAYRVYDHMPTNEELQQFIDYCSEKYPKYKWCACPTDYLSGLYQVTCFAL